MKKHYIFFTITFFNLFLSMAQTSEIESHRWRNDDGSETTATWKSARNTSTKINRYDEILRLRMTVEFTGGSFSNDDIEPDEFQYRQQGSGLWVNITSNQADGDFYFVDSNNLVHNQETTQQLSSDSFISGRIVESSSTVTSINIRSSRKNTEIEYVIAPSSSYDNTKVYEFRINDSDLSVSNPNLSYPRIIPNTTYCPQLIAPSANAQLFCPNSNSTVADLIPAPSATINWYDSLTATTPLLNTTDLVTGDYYVAQTSNGCESSRTMVAITVSNLSVLISSQTNSTNCNNACDGNATVSVTGGEPPYTYQWTNGVTLPSLGGLGPGQCPGNYNVTVTDASGCEASISVTIEPPVLEVPTITIPVFYYQGDTAVALTATSGADGTGILWYTTATGGVGSATAPIPSTSTIGSSSYWVSSTYTNGCESDRVELVVTILEKPEPTAPTTNFTTQIYTGDNKTLADLAVIGAAIKWYDASTGGTLLVPTTVLVDNTTYYASQTIDDVESTDRVAIKIERISDSTQILASGSTVADLITTLSTGTSAQWFSEASGGTQLVGTTPLTLGNYYVEQFSPDIAVTTFLSRGRKPQGIAVQSDGKFLVTTSDNTVIRMDADGSNIITLAIGFNRPTCIAVQPDGKILVADTGNNTIKRMDADGSNIVTLGSEFSAPFAIAVQPDGGIVVADTGNGAIKRMDANGTNIVTLTSGLSTTRGVAIQPDGKILIASVGTVRRMNADGSNIITLANSSNGIRNSTTLAIQPDGKILTVNTLRGELIRMDADGSNVEILADIRNGIFAPVSVLSEPDGKILVVLSGDDIKRIALETLSNRVPVSVNVSLSTDRFLSKNFKIYPNPTTERLYINNKILKNGTLKVYDLNGRIFINEDLEGETLELDFSSLAKGVYILNILTEGGNYVQKIVKK